MGIPHADFSIGGGSSVQLAQTRKELQSLGITVELFDSGKAYRKGDADLVHLFGANPAMYDLSQRLVDLEIPYVVSTIFFTMHHPRFLRTVLNLEKLAGKFFGGIWTDYGVVAAICRKAAAVLPNTSHEARLLIKGLSQLPEKVSVIPNGVEERFAAATADLFVKTYGLEDFILYVGNLGSLRKNALSLIRALGPLQQPAVLIGKIFDNSYGNICRGEAEKFQHIHLLGPLDHDDPLLASAYAAAGVFVLPAYFETPGIAAMEAALSGTRIVITENGGTADYFGDHAIYVNPKSVNSIRNGIKASLNSSHDGQALRQHILGNYLWSVAAAKTAAVYRKVLEAKND